MSAAVDPQGATIESISCPSPVQCTVQVVQNHPLLAVACPLVTQCTAVDDDEFAVTFNPQAPTSGIYGMLGTPAASSITGVACPFDLPMHGGIRLGGGGPLRSRESGHASKPVTIFAGSAVAVACPTALRCVAVDAAGSELTFSPRAPAEATTAAVDPAQPAGLACPSSTYCVTVDVAGNAVGIRPRGWRGRRQRVGGRRVARPTISRCGTTRPETRCPSPLAGVVEPETGVTFPDLNAHGGEATQTNLILPEPTQFLRKDLPVCSVVRPTLDESAGAVATIKSFTADRLFEGQSPKFFNTVMRLAREADAAQRHVNGR